MRREKLPKYLKKGFFFFQYLGSKVVSDLECNCVDRMSVNPSPVFLLLLLCCRLRGEGEGERRERESDFCPCKRRREKLLARPKQRRRKLELSSRPLPANPPPPPPPPPPLARAARKGRPIQAVAGGAAAVSVIQEGERRDLKRPRSTRKQKGEEKLLVSLKEEEGGRGDRPTTFVGDDGGGRKRPYIPTYAMYNEGGEGRLRERERERERANFFWRGKI